MKSTIDQLIINSPYKEPSHYWSYDRETRSFTLKEGRRPAGYVIASENSKSFDDPGVFIEIPLVNTIRPRVKTWCEAGFPGVTGITKRLLEHWHNPEEREHRRFFFCQLEAIETLIWVTEAAESEKVGIEIPSDGGLFKRLCSKMATGSGKTIVNAEYVNIFGVPFTFLPHESQDGPPPPPPPPKTRIEPVKEKQHYEINWPNIIRIDHVYKPELKLDMNLVKILELNASDTATLAELAPIVDGKPDVTKISEINLEGLGQKYRMQKIIFETARDVFDQMRPNWKGNKEFLLAQLIGLMEAFLSSGRLKILPPLFNRDDLRRRILIILNMNNLVQHIWEAIRFENTESIIPIFDSDHPIRSTGNMQTWYTGKPCEYTKRSHINFFR